MKKEPFHTHLMDKTRCQRQLTDSNVLDELAIFIKSLFPSKSPITLKVGKKVECNIKSSFVSLT